jgi:hypothetical protein
MLKILTEALLQGWSERAYSWTIDWLLQVIVGPSCTNKSNRISAPYDIY